MTDDVVPVELILVDWAGTLTVPMGEMLRHATDHLGWSPDLTDRVVGAMTDYFVRDDTVLHRAEAGLADQAEVIAWLEAQHEGASALFDVDAPSFLNAPDRPEMIDLLWRLQDHDVAVWLATNNYAFAQDALAERYLVPGLVSAIVNSSLVGVRKPDPRFWAIVLDAAEVEPAAVVLLDDSERNLSSAREVGMRAIAVGDDAVPAIEALLALVDP